MTWLADGFASGRVIDVILALTAAEFLALVAWNRLTRRGPNPAALAANLAAGALLLLAVRSALTQAWWPFVAAPLALALVAHLLDLWTRKN